MNTIYSVTQLNNHSKSIIENNFYNVWVKGEISSIKNYHSGHLYFILKDDESELPCVFYNYSNDDLRDGLNITLNGKLSFTLYTDVLNTSISVSINSFISSLLRVLKRLMSLAPPNNAIILS